MARPQNVIVKIEKFFRRDGNEDAIFSRSGC